MDTKTVSLSDIIHVTYLELIGIKYNHFTINEKGRKIFHYSNLTQQDLNDLVRDYYNSEYARWEDIKSRNVTIAKRM